MDDSEGLSAPVRDDVGGPSGALDPTARRRRLLHALLELSAAGPLGGDLEPALQRLAEQLAEVGGFPRVVVFLVDGLTGELWPAAAVGVTAEQLQALRQEPESPQVVRSRLRAASIGRRTLQDDSMETLVVPLRDADGGWTGMVAADLGTTEADAVAAATVELIADRAEAQVVRAQLDEVLTRLALVDVDTGLVNRQGLMDALARELVRAERSGRPAAVMALRLDAGRGAGPGSSAVSPQIAMVPSLAAAVRDRLRRGDLAARLDESTLALLLPETVEAAARVVADDLHARIRDLAVQEPADPWPTVSVGLACSSGRGSTADDLLGSALDALDRAAAAGGDRVAYV
ncbi:MAG TPA: GGDEF domain-containing protein [Candidatus Micrarchaeia archaeon]|nr:GGDEF domain-containing protein [Candidatus Micrarchaeia archaeon]